MSAPRVALDYVSPLPPVRSGISDYSVDLLPELSRRADVRVLRLPGQPVSDDVERRFHPQPLDRLGEGGRLPLYQMGNNRYHSAVRAAAMRVPGVVTLHDVVLHHLLLDETIGHDDWDTYHERLTAEHGWIGDVVAGGAWWGVHAAAAQFSLPAHRTLLRRQRGTVVHSRYAAALICDGIPDAAVAVVAMPIPLPKLPDAAAARAFRARHGLPAGAFVLGSFGFQTPIKRTDVAIAALARPEMRAVHLLVAGEVAEALDFERLAREAGVADRVHVTGFLGAEEFAAAIMAADLSLNLRYPSAGETSAALLRVLALGRPAVVSDFAQFAELPSEIAVRVALDEPVAESAALARTVAALQADPARLRAMGEASRAHIAREHDPSRSAAALADACLAFADRAPLGDAPPDEAPMTTLLAPQADLLLDVEGAEQPWPAGERRRLRLRLHNRGAVSLLAAERGEGGLAIRVGLRDADGVDLAGSEPWKALPRDLLPGESCQLEIDVRRPPGPAVLRLEPHVVGRSGLPFHWTGSAVWESRL